MGNSTAAESSAPGVLYFDPNATTAKLATASLRLAGFEVLNVATKDEAVAAFRAHGPSGSGAIAALLLDTSADPRMAAVVLGALVALPGAAEVPGILIVSRRNPEPIPGTEALPRVRRPFSTPALLKVVRRTIAAHQVDAERVRPPETGTRERRLRALIGKHLGEVDADAVRNLLSDLDQAEELPSLYGDSALDCELSLLPLEAILETLGNARLDGVLRVQAEGRRGELHLFRGAIRLGVYRGDDEDLRLGRFVVDGAHMQHDELEDYVIGHDPEGRPLGRRLVDGGFLSRSQLGAIVMQQARETACHLLTFRDGRVSFQSTESPHPLIAYIDEAESPRLSVAAALLEGMRRVADRASMGPHMPQVEDIYLRVDEQIQRLGRESFDGEELSVLEATNGRNSVKDIARRTRAGSLAVAKVLYRLGKAKVVRKRMPPVTV